MLTMQQSSKLSKYLCWSRFMVSSNVCINKYRKERGSGKEAGYDRPVPFNGTESPNSLIENVAVGPFKYNKN